MSRRIRKHISMSQHGSNDALRALVILSPHVYRVVERETDPNKQHSLVLPVRRASRNLVHRVDQLTYYADERCEDAESAISERYGIDYPNRKAIRAEMTDDIETIRTHRVVSPLGSQLAIYVKWFHNQLDGEPLDANYVDAMHSFSQ